MEFTLDNVPIRYILGTYIDDPGYPQPVDILYLMTKRAADRGKDLDPVTFTMTQIQKKVGEGYENNIEASIEELIKENYIEMTRETKATKSFTIIKNPFL